MRQAFSGAEVVVHAASVVHRPGATAAEYELFNRDGTRALVAAAQSAGVGHIVFLSTIKVYGDGRLETADEATPTRPEDPYSATKAEAEQIVLDGARLGGPAATVLRLAPVYGRGDKGNVRKVISAIAHKRFLLPGDGSTRKSLVHLSVIGEVMKEVVARRAGGVFVVADPVAPSMRELADACAAALGVRRPVAIPAGVLRSVALPVEAVFKVLGRQPPVSRALIRKSLLPTTFSPRKVLARALRAG